MPLEVNVTARELMARNVWIFIAKQFVISKSVVAHALSISKSFILTILIHSLINPENSTGGVHWSRLTNLKANTAGNATLNT